MIGWITVTYRSVILWVMGLLFLAIVGFYFAFPKVSQSIMASGGNLLGALLDKIGSSAPPGKAPKAVGDQKASFTMLDGSVKVKKKSSNTWVNAGYDVPLEKGDVVQTGS